MDRWFETKGKPQGIVVSSRVRLARNIDGYVFPGRMDEAARAGFLEETRRGLKNLDYRYLDLGRMPAIEKQALRERRVINSAMAGRQEAMGLYLSEDESISILMGGDDHLRIQCMLAGASLHKGWEILDQLDDQINETYEYAFSQKYGYLTSFPTNMGTGLRASVIMHLPLISRERGFKHLTEEIARMGVSLKALGTSSTGEHYGCLYNLSNQKTLGLSEQEILANVERLAMQLAAQERKAENELVSSRRMEVEDEVFKSYGVLRYARKLSYKESMMYLSSIRMGMANGVIRMKEPVNIFSLMLGTGHGSLTEYAGQPIPDDQYKVVRAEYIRANLPEVKE